MPKQWWWAFSTYVALILLSVYVLMPSFLGVTHELRESPTAPQWTKWLPPTVLNLGLDLKGGVHIVLGVEVEKAVEHEVERLAIDAKEFLKTKNIEVVSSLRVPDQKRFRMELKSPQESDQAQKVMRDEFYTVAEFARTVDGRLEYALRADWETLIRDRVLDQALKIIRNRIDEFGVAEPTVQKQSGQQILVQLPGVKDPERAIQLIGKTASLEFKIVSEKLPKSELMALVDAHRDAAQFRDNFTSQMVKALNQALKGKLPENTEVAFSKETDRTTGAVVIEPYLLESPVLMTGDALQSAQVQEDAQLRMPEVGLQFSSSGARTFERITGENVNRALAILLDGVVMSAPNIQNRIAGGSARITLGRGNQQKMLEEAQDLALVLRAGSLPAPVQVLENRTVGASLGADSIERGTISLIGAALLVSIFMLIYYRTFGIIANIALILNALFIFALLALFEATLTLPGLAGIVLTIGMAVDANVIINERIRDELGWGKGIRGAIEAGYSNANRTLVDANLTTITAGFALYYFGTGPIRGFAVTLLVGIVTSYFTAVIVTKTIVDFWLKRTKTDRLFGIVPKAEHLKSASGGR